MYNTDRPVENVENDLLGRSLFSKQLATALYNYAGKDVLMDKSVFVKTMIDVLKYDSLYNNLEGKNQVIKLLSRAKANFLPQYGFVSGGVSSQRWEIIELRFPVPLLDEANKKMKLLNELADYVYEETEEHAFQKINIRPLVMEGQIEL